MHAAPPPQRSTFNGHGARGSVAEPAAGQAAWHPGAPGTHGGPPQHAAAPPPGAALGQFAAYRPGPAVPPGAHGGYAAFAAGMGYPGSQPPYGYGPMPGGAGYGPGFGVAYGAVGHAPGSAAGAPAMHPHVGGGHMAVSPAHARAAAAAQAALAAASPPPSMSAPPAQSPPQPQHQEQGRRPADAGPGDSEGTGLPPGISPLLEGFLTKQGHARSSWRRRWCVLTASQLLYFKRRGATKLQGCISLPAVERVAADARLYPEPFCFQLVTAKRQYAFRAASQQEMLQWMGGVQAAVDAIRASSQEGAGAQATPPPERDTAESPSWPNPAPPVASASEPAPVATAESGEHAPAPVSQVQAVPASPPPPPAATAPAVEAATSAALTADSGCDVDDLVEASALGGMEQALAALGASLPGADRPSPSRGETSAVTADSTGGPAAAGAGGVDDGAGPMGPPPEAAAPGSGWSGANGHGTRRGGPSGDMASRGFQGSGGAVLAEGGVSLLTQAGSLYAMGPSGGDGRSPGKGEEKEEDEFVVTAAEAAGATAEELVMIKRGDGQVLGTVKVLRTMSVKQLHSVLRSYEVPERELRNSSRKALVARVVALSRKRHGSRAARVVGDEEDARAARRRAAAGGGGGGGDRDSEAGGGGLRKAGHFRSVKQQRRREEKDRKAADPRRRMTRAAAAQYMRWIDSLHVSESRVTSLADACRTGMLLVRLLQACMPRPPPELARGLFERACTKKTCLLNLEKALSVVWKLGLPVPHIPSAEQIYEGTTRRLPLLMRDLFEELVLKGARVRAKESIAWLARTAAMYGYEWDAEVASAAEPPHEALREELRCCTPLLCTLHYYYGDDPATRRAAHVPLRDVYWSALDEQAQLHNREVLFNALEALDARAGAGGVGVMWDEDGFPDAVLPDLLLAQVDALYLCLRGRPSALPTHDPASSSPPTRPHLVKDAHGRTVVAAAAFRDRGPLHVEPQPMLEDGPAEWAPQEQHDHGSEEEKDRERGGRGGVDGGDSRSSSLLRDEEARLQALVENLEQGAAPQGHGSASTGGSTGTGGGGAPKPKRAPPAVPGAAAAKERRPVQVREQRRRRIASQRSSQRRGSYFGLYTPGGGAQAAGEENRVGRVRQHAQRGEGEVEEAPPRPQLADRAHAAQAEQDEAAGGAGRPDAGAAGRGDGAPASADAPVQPHGAGAEDGPGPAGEAEEELSPEIVEMMQAITEEERRLMLVEDRRTMHFARKAAQGAGAGRQQGTGVPAPAQRAHPVPSGRRWRRVFTDDGEAYFYHAETRETSWDVSPDQVMTAEEEDAWDDAFGSDGEEEASDGEDDGNGLQAAPVGGGVSDVGTATQWMGAPRTLLLRTRAGWTPFAFQAVQVSSKERFVLKWTPPERPDVITGLAALPDIEAATETEVEGFQAVVLALRAASDVAENAGGVPLLVLRSPSGDGTELETLLLHTQTLVAAVRAGL